VENRFRPFPTVLPPLHPHPSLKMGAFKTFRFIGFVYVHCSKTEIPTFSDHRRILIYTLEYNRIEDPRPRCPRARMTEMLKDVF